MIDTISIKMLKTLKRGVDTLGNEARQRIKLFVESQLAVEGGFCNKSGCADLYYTSFGLLLSHVLGVDFNKEKMERYLQQIDVENLDLVHYAAYMRCCMLCRLAQSKIGFAINALRREPIRDLESFSSLPNNDIRSPYSQFILYSLLEDTSNATNFLAFDDYQTPSGYTNIFGSENVSTNATAAALMVKGQALGYDKSDMGVDQLSEMQLECGGFKAERSTPMPDLLSTATALFALKCYDVEPKFSAAEFVEAHWLDSGGFAATVLDSKSDVEYTFYGLLALGTL